MENDKSDDKIQKLIEKFQNEIENYTGYEGRGAWGTLNAIFQSFPGLATVATMIENHVNLATERSLKKFALLLAEQLQQLGNRIDTETVTTDEFADLFKSCFWIAVRTTQEEKLKAASSIIANILLREGDPDKLSFTDLDHFVHCLDSLSTGAIEILGKAYTHAPKTDKALNREPIKVYFNSLQQEMENMDPDLIMGLIQNLGSVNLLHAPNLFSGIRTYRNGHPYGNEQIELTSLGMKFVEYLLQSEDSDKNRQ